MLQNRLLLSGCLLLLAGCGNLPEPYAPPPQRGPAAQTGTPVLGRFVTMRDADVALYIVQDIAASSDASWRWTYRKPELRFRLDAVDQLKFVMDFSLADITLRDTGPVTLQISINGKPFQKIHCDKPGERHFEEPVPPSLLKEEAINTVTIEPDKVWISKDDGAALGFILTSAGFVD